MDLIVTGNGFAAWGEQQLRCTIGRHGIVSAAAKWEGDGATPAGRWLMQRLFYRADRLTHFSAPLPLQSLRPEDGWCDAPDDPHYNQFVQHPYRAEQLWRDDHLYDVIVVLGYNDAPIVPGKGSAIFLHIAPDDFGPSAGCVTLARADLLNVLATATPDSAVVVVQ